MITCTRKLQFCAGHRVRQHEGKCRNLHGHNYEVEIEAVADELDAVGRVIDFSVLKEKVGGWIDSAWDHQFIVCHDDQEARNAIAYAGTQIPFCLPYNPTAENMAKYLLEVVCPTVLDGTGVKVRRVIVHETPNCFAEANLTP